MQLAEDEAEVLSWLTGAYLPLDAAPAAIARYQLLSPRELHERMTLFRKPEQRKAYLDGIDLVRRGTIAILDRQGQTVDLPTLQNLHRICVGQRV